MNQKTDVQENEIEKLCKKLREDAESSGYNLNDDAEFTKGLVRGLLINEKRYGYQSCPCRLATGDKKTDLDIICPCDYRDSDLDEYDACYCALYVSKKVLEGKKKIGPIPERRVLEEKTMNLKKEEPKLSGSDAGSPSLPVWRCKVCGYLCARNEPPEICPICRVPRERFERFM